ncbi:unnamed protein product [Symbiodinium natans]|uniref:Uncharacterized protein n=1 Tax=Symbiodinium natans TaxID=878477 RepID=A0A812P2I1_9DINO|nr:unnamed protein product [Symbiodinium natans]
MGSGGSKKAQKSSDPTPEKETPPEKPAESSTEKPAEPSATPAEPVESGTTPAEPMMPVPVTDDGPYRIVDPPDDFVVEGLKVCAGALEDHGDVREGKVLQVAKHPGEHVMKYWLKVEYGPHIAFVHTLMSCGWTSDHVIREVGDAQFPPDPQNVPASETAPRAEAEAAAADAADLEVPGPGGDEPYTIFLVEQIMDAPEAFILESLQSCESTAVQEGKVIQVAKHPSEHVMQYWLKVGDASFPPDPRNLPTSKAVPLPDLKPGDYDQEFVDPSHLDAIATNADLKSIFPEASSGQVRSIWRGAAGFWLEVTAEAEDEPERYGAHFVEPEPGSQQYVLTCAVRLPKDEEFPPEPRTTRGKAVAFNTP